ncbi:hypothetical protein FRC02_002588, partial [Tulasnella sp. 418]
KPARCRLVARLDLILPRIFPLQLRSEDQCVWLGVVREVTLSCPIIKLKRMMKHLIILPLSKDHQRLLL